MIKAVITGDIVHSSKMNTQHKEMLYNGIAAALESWGKDFKMKSELYRGDSFQCLMGDVAYALRMALVIKTYIRSITPADAYVKDTRKGLKGNIKEAMLFNPMFIFDARITIGIGDTGKEMKNLAASDGEAFLLSGRELDEIKATRRSISIASADKYAEELRTESVLLNAILDKTTALQCEVIYLKLLGYTETEIADMLRVFQSAVNQRSNSAGWFAIDAMVKRFETIYG